MEKEKQKHNKQTNNKRKNKTTVKKNHYFFCTDILMYTNIYNVFISYIQIHICNPQYNPHKYSTTTIKDLLLNIHERPI